MITCASAQSTFTDELNIPITDFEFNGIYSSEIKLNKVGKKTIKIHVYESNINAFYGKPVKIAFGKIEILDRKKMNGPTMLFDGNLFRKGKEIYLKIKYIEDNGSNVLKFKKGTKLKFVNDGAPRIQYTGYSLGDFELLKVAGTDTFSSLIENYYLQKLKDRYRDGNIGIGQRTIERYVYKDDEMLLYNYGMRGLSISTKINELKDIYDLSTIRADYSFSGRPNVHNSGYFNALKKEMGEMIYQTLSNKGSFVFSYLPNADKIELYNNGEHNFDAFVKRENGNLSFTIKPTADFENRLAALTEEFIQKEKMKEQLRLEKLRAEKIERQKQFEKEFDLVRSELPSDQRIAMIDIMREESNIHFFQYIYYGFFSKAKNYHKPESDYFSALYCNFHILLSKENSEYFKTNSDYSQVTISNEDQTRIVWIEKRYESALKESARKSKVAHSNFFAAYNLMDKLDLLAKDMKSFVDVYDPNSEPMIRLRENLYRYNMGISAL